MTRRGLLVAAAIALAASLTACGTRAGSSPAAGDAGAHHHAPFEEAPGRDRPSELAFDGAVAQVERKSASKMTPAEIDRFQRAFSYAVTEGYFDVFNDAHFDHLRNRNHGFELLATAPPTARVGLTPAWGHRLLPWHRAFILEAERMLRVALRERNLSEGRNPAEADSLFIPYWDAAHDQTLPAWVQAYQPRGGTAAVPPGLPTGHPQSGRRVGSRYDIEFGRWPGNNAAFDRLPKPEQVARFLAHDDFDRFYRGIEADPVIVESAIPAALGALDTLGRKFPDDPNVRTILDLVRQGPPPRDIDAAKAAVASDIKEAVKLVDAGLGVGYLATAEGTRPQPDREVLAAVKAVQDAVIFPPHVVLHLWAGGVDPTNPQQRGTVTYFNELTVDPVFWMLHTELDRWWYTWEQTHTGRPQLTGEDAEFQPLTPKQGAWYRGGRTYILSELTPTPQLPYRYAELFTP